VTLPGRVLITGAAGNLGAKLRRHMEGRCGLVLIDRAGGDGVLVADLSAWDESWVAHFRGVDAVVHLAGNPVAYAPWPELIGPNIDAVLNVFEASARGGVKRVVFASSNHVMGGYQDEPAVPITPQLPPRPGLRYGADGAKRDSGPYGATKLFGERVGKHYADARGLSVIAVRIGWVWRGENTPAELPADRGPWFRQMWLSDRDYLHLMDCCLGAELAERFVIVNGMSANGGMRWDLGDTARLLGFRPADDVTAS
jgi:uronate dehydrogenase